MVHAYYGIKVPKWWGRVKNVYCSVPFLKLKNVYVKAKCSFEKTNKRIDISEVLPLEERKQCKWQ